MSNPEQPGEETILEAQQELLETSLPLVFAAYDAARQAGIGQPVVFLLDCEDEIGREIANNWLGTATVQDAVEQRRLTEDEHPEEQTTVFAHAFPRQECLQEVPEVFPYLAPVFEQDPPQEGFLAIAVTCGGASALTVPLSARQS
ncbi:MAG: hypothetical protein MI725_03125 [Pirellulales bacterium]|nr:hypothetical protein [Pirellulales bacterium]